MASPPLPRRVPWPAAWLGLLGLGLALYLAAWPLAWRWVILPAASLPAAQASGPDLLRHLVWRVPVAGEWRLAGRLAPAGGIWLDRRAVALAGPRAPRRQMADPALAAGPHLLTTRGVTSFLATPPGGVAAPPPPASLRGLDLADPGAWLGAVTAAEYLGLALMAAGTLGLAWRGALPAAWRGEPAWRLAGLAGGVALCLLLRAGAGLDLAPPAWPARGLALLGAAAGLAALLSGLLRFWSPASPNGADESAWPAALTGLGALAVIARALFLPQMEYKSDEETIWHLALNLAREGIPYLAGAPTSQGGFNPPAFLYLLAPAALGVSPLWGGAWTALAGGAAAGLGALLGRRLLGPWPGLAAGLLLALAPWPVRLAMKLWPQTWLCLGILSICLLLPGWLARGGRGRSLVLGLLAGLITQLHFTGALWLGGLGLAALAGRTPLPWRRLPLLAAAGLLTWLPYLLFLGRAAHGGGTDWAGILAGAPGSDPAPLWRLAELLGGAGLGEALTLGKPADGFAAQRWLPYGATWGLAGLLALAGLVRLWVRRPPGPAPELARLFCLALLPALAGLILLGLPAPHHYLFFALPWPQFLAGLALWQLGGGGGGGFRRGLALGLLLALALANAAFLWQWQTYLGATGGGGEYGEVFFLAEPAERLAIAKARLCPIRGTVCGSSPPNPSRGDTLRLPPRRAPLLLVLALLMGLAAGTCLGLSQAAGRRVAELAVAAADPAGRGFGLFRYQNGDWTGAPALYWRTPGLDLASGRDPAFSGAAFTLRAAALLQLDQGDRRELTLAGDDQVILLVDGHRVLADLGIHPARPHRIELDLKPGPHLLEVLHRQEGGGAALSLTLPAAWSGRLLPLGRELDPARLWRLERQCQLWQARAWLAGGLGLLTLLLYLPPLGTAWPGRLAGLIRRRWPELLLLAAWGLLAGLFLDTSPGQDGDQAHFAITAFEWHWRGHGLHPWADYTDQRVMVWPLYLAQLVLPFSLAGERLLALLANLAALGLLGRAAERLAGRRAGLFALLLAGFSAWYLFFGREYYELAVAAPLCLGLALWGVARAGETRWGAPLAGAVLAGALWTHSLLVILAIGLGAGLLAAKGPGLLRRGRFWLGMAVFLALTGRWFWLYLQGGITHPGHQLDVGALLARGWHLFAGLLPGLLDGKEIALYWSGRLAWPVVPWLPLLLAACLLAWPWLRPRPAARPLLRGLFLGTLAASLALALKIPVVELRYLEVPALGLSLWLAVFLADLAGRSRPGRRPAGRGGGPGGAPGGLRLPAPRPSGLPRNRRRLPALSRPGIPRRPQAGQARPL